MILLFIIIVFPLYLVMEQSSNDGSDSIACRYYFYDMILSFGGRITRNIVQVIFGMSVLIALTSLSYGSEIAYRLLMHGLLNFKVEEELKNMILKNC
jgi:hypothetical protein